jgi:hypothetical protein
MSKLKPTEIKDKPWLIEENEKLILKFMDLNNVGKWMLFYLLEDLDEAWERAVKYYNEEEIEDIVSLQVSTNCNNITKSEYIDTGVILFICNDSYDEDSIIKIGKNIINKMRYVPIDSKYIYYKTNEQTSIGSRITGEKKNYLYRIEV